MEVTIIAALGKNQVIGKDNQLIWHLPKDMKFFKDTTEGHTVIMGRKNYFSIPEKFRPLPKRKNIVVSRQKNLKIPEVEVFYTIEQAIEQCKNNGESEVFIIGGGQIYAYVLKNSLATKMYLTHIDNDFEGDTFFPKFNAELWKSNLILQHVADQRNPFDFEILVYKK